MGKCALLVIGIVAILGSTSRPKGDPQTVLAFLAGLNAGERKALNEMAGEAYTEIHEPGTTGEERRENGEQGREFAVKHDCPEESAEEFGIKFATSPMDAINPKTWGR